VTEPGTNLAPGTVRRPRRRRAVFVLVAIVAVVVVIELGGAVAWSLLHGTTFSWAAANAHRAEVAAALGVTPQGTGGTGEGAAQAAARSTVALHPYFGFVTDATPGTIGGFAISAFGFVDDASPLRKGGSDRYVVGLVGGSVALQLGLYAGGELTAALARSKQLAGRHIEIVRLGLGGWKQPQQLLAVQLLSLLGGHFDCIINLDGFNEVALVAENVPLGVPAWFPRGWAGLLDARPTPAQQRRVGHLVVLGDDRREWLRWGERFWWSPAAQLVWTVADRRLGQQLAAVEVEAAAAAAAASAGTFAATGPGAGNRDVAAARTEMVAVWQRSSRALHELCRQRGIRYCHFLQPNQYVADSKPIGGDEALLALAPEHPYAAGVREGYPQLQAAGAALRADGVSFHDLTRIFADHPEPLYVDTCCHLGRTGNVLLAEHIAAVVRSELDLSGFVLAQLRVEPQRLALDSPLTVAVVRTFGRDAAGSEVELTGSAMGTQLVPTPEGAVLVGPDGGVRAQRRGDATLQVQHGVHRAEVGLTAAWPDVVTGDDSVALADGTRPTLTVVANEPAGGDATGSDATTTTVQCTGLPPNGLRVLVQSASPLPATPPAGLEAYGLSAQALGEGPAPRATVRGSIPAGRPLFLRAYCLAAEGGTVVAASNTLVLTRG
jgi:hypothetical protein